MAGKNVEIKLLWRDKTFYRLRGRSNSVRMPVVSELAGANFPFAQVGVLVRVRLANGSYNPYDRNKHGCNNASNAGCWCSLWSPNPFLEPKDGSVHLRSSQSYSHHQPGKVRSAVCRSRKLCAQIVRE